VSLVKSMRRPYGRAVPDASGSRRNLVPTSG
jgi:hypothetical protein